MPTHDQEFSALHAVLQAARGLLEARDDGMLTADEWSALQEAVAATEAPDPGQLAETFSIEGDVLVRRVAPKRGVAYTHRCEKDVFEAVCHAIDEMGGDPRGFNLELVRAKCEAPWTQVAVALAFLKERSCIVPATGGNRRHMSANDDVHCDAMIEWYAVRDASTDSA